MSLRRPGYLVLVLMVGTVGCKPKSAAVPAVSPAPPVTEGTPASEAETKEFAAQLEAAAAAKDRAKMHTLLAIEDLAVRCAQDIPLDARQKQGLLQGLRRGAQNNSFANELLDEFGKGAKYQLLRVHTVDGRPRAMFRLITSELGINYHDFILCRSPDGRLGLEDVYVVATGELLSQTLRRLLLPAAAEMNRGLLAELRGTDKTFLNNLPRVKSMIAAVQAGNAGEAIAIYRSLPPELRAHKVIALQYIQAAALLGDADYAAAIQEFRRLFPGDPALDLLSIDYFRLNKQFDEAVRCVRNVHAAVGGDPYLRSMEGTLLAEGGKFKEAREASEKAIAEAPKLEDLYWARIDIALRAKDHPDTLNWLKKVVEECDIAIADLTAEADYAEFVKSPQHAEWLKWYEAREKE